MALLIHAVKLDMWQIKIHSLFFFPSALPEGFSCSHLGIEEFWNILNNIYTSAWNKVTTLVQIFLRLTQWNTSRTSVCLGCGMRGKVQALHLGCPQDVFQDVWSFPSGPNFKLYVVHTVDDAQFVPQLSSYWHLLCSFRCFFPTHAMLPLKGP